MSHLERRQREKEELKQKILNAAQSIAAKDGWHAVTIRKIADAIEYTPPIVYEHFENKEDLIKELVYTGFEKMFSALHEIRQKESDPKKLILALSLMHWDFAFNNTDLFRLMYSLERQTTNEQMLESMNTIHSTFRELSNNDDKLVHELIFTWMCLMNGAITFFLKMPCKPHHIEETPRELYEKMIRRFIDTLDFIK